MLVNAHDSKAKMMLRTCAHLYPTRDGPLFMHPKKECPRTHVNFKAIVGFSLLPSMFLIKVGISLLLWRILLPNKVGITLLAWGIAGTYIHT